MKINIASHISELLYRHNQVNVPGLGGFYAAYRETTIDKYGNILPPSKELRFDERSIFHDDKLIQSLVNEYDLTFAEAIETVENFVKSVKSDLQNKAVVISTIGRLYLDARGEIVLAPSSQNFLEDSFGLPKLQKHLISRRHPKKEKNVPPVAVEAVGVPKKTSKFRRVFAGIWGDSNLRILIIIIAVFMLVVPQLYRLANPANERIDPSVVEGNSELITENQSNLIDKNATFNPFEKTVTNNGETPNKTPENDKITPKEVTEDIIEDPAKKINLESKTSVKPVAEAPVKPIVTTPKLKANTKNYIIVIGNFSTQDNANFAIKGVQKAGYKSYSTKVSTAKIRVGIEINCTANEIDAKLLQVKTEYPDSWLMNR